MLHPGLVLITRPSIFPRLQYSSPPYGVVARVKILLLLRVLLDSHLLFAPHVTKTLAQAAQSMRTLKVLKFSELPMHSLSTVCRPTLVARLLYASPSCWGGHL